VSRRPAVAHVGLLAALLLAVAACGVPTQSRARAIANDQQISDVTTPTVVAGPTARRIELYFVDSDRLVKVERGIDQVPDPTVAVDQLLSGVTAREKDRGLVSAIPPDTSAHAVSLSNGVLTIDLSENFKPVGDTYVEACAQIVYTVTALSDVTAVRFLVDGDLINPPTVDDGNLPQVDRSNYRTLAP